MPGRKSTPSSDCERFQVKPRRSGNASLSGASMFDTTGEISARSRFSASSRRIARTFSSAGRPSSSASQTQSAPSDSACSMPSANPPAPPRLRCDGRYVHGSG